MALDLTPHKLKKVGNEVRVEKVNPHARIKIDAGTFYIQGGKCYAGANSRPLRNEEIPLAMWAMLKSMNPRVIAECGWTEKLAEHFDLNEKGKVRKPRKKKETGAAGNDTLAE